METKGEENILGEVFADVISIQRKGILFCSPSYLARCEISSF
jgi:hypothetical protein